MSGTAAMAGVAALNVGAQSAVAQGTAGKPREYYMLRKYELRSGPQGKLTDAYVEQALIPALNKLGITPVGAFRLTYGPDTPALYVLMPSTNLETLVTVDLKLQQDAAFMKAAEPFWGAPAIAPAFVREESSLHAAFEGFPRLVVPDTKAKRIFHLRTYESPSQAAHVRKVEMFNSGEFDFFAKAGCKSVFYGDTLIGSRTPSLTYMLTFPDLNALTEGWAKFSADPDWKKLAGSPRFNYEPIVSNVANLVLTPTAYSQI
jgi:hypothetical protein